MNEKSLEEAMLDIVIEGYEIIVNRLKDVRAVREKLLRLSVKPPARAYVV